MIKIFYGVETREGTTGNDDLDDFPVDTGDTSMESSAKYDIQEMPGNPSVFTCRY